MNRKLLLLLLLPAALLCGCNVMAYTLYVLFPGSREKTIEAEYAGLDGNSVAVVVYADRATRYEHFEVRRSVSAAVLGELVRHVDEVDVIDPARVVKYQRENIYWDEMDKTELGKAFGADYILFISLIEFSTREPGSLNLYRGRITGQVDLYKVSLPERSARVFRAREVRVRYPEHDPTGQPSEGDRDIRERTERLFAEKLVKKFYQHKVPIE